MKIKTLEESYDAFYLEHSRAIENWKWFLELNFC
jgi:hypothetical protein